MAPFRILREKLLSGALDVIGLVLFAITALLAVFSVRIRNDALHAFKRNFWGTRGPSLDGRPVVWMHAVSVGEMRICQPLLAYFTDHRPDLQFVLSVGTTDAMTAATRELPGTSLFFAPFDFSWAVRRTFDLVKPVALIISENDFWAQMLNEARRRHVPLAIFNTRMSPREQTEHRWNAWVLRPGLQRTAWWGAVTEDDARWIRHFFDVASPPLEVTGSLKLDGQTRDPQNPRTQELRRNLSFSSEHQIIVAGSTHETEERLIAAVAARLAVEFPNLRLVIVPRSISRAGEILHQLHREHLDVVIGRDRSLNHAAFITILDSLGILQDLWGLADVAFVGGSFVRHGGQNMVEPASYGKPICFGPHTWNFQPIVTQLLNSDAARQVQSEAELESTIRNWLVNKAAAQEIGARAQAVVTSQTKPLRRTINGIRSILPEPMGRTDSPAIMMATGHQSCATTEAS